MFCNYCKSQIPDQSKFCPNCGATLAPAPINTSPIPPVPPQQPYPQPGNPPYANQRPQKKKSGCLIMALFAIAAIIFFLSTQIKNADVKENITTVLDCSKFSRISTDELKK